MRGLSRTRCEWSDAAHLLHADYAGSLGTGSQADDPAKRTGYYPGGVAADSALPQRQQWAGATRGTADFLGSGTPAFPYAGGRGWSSSSRFAADLQPMSHH